jgi:hypothetical protein
MFTADILSIYDPFADTAVCGVYGSDKIPSTLAARLDGVEETGHISMAGTAVWCQSRASEFDVVSKIGR